MRLGIISDIHCNIESLDTALERMSDTVDEVLCAGDSILGFRFSNDVIARLREIGARVVLGNHDLDVLSPQGVRVREDKQTDQELLRWLYRQPTRIDTIIGNRRLTMFHAAPSEPMDYIYTDSTRLKEFGDLGAAFVVYGHTHFAMAEQVGRTLVINPGSTGQPRDPTNGFRASYAILDTSSAEVTFDVYDDPLHPPRYTEWSDGPNAAG